MMAPPPLNPASVPGFRVNLMVHIGGRFEGDGESKKYDGGEQIAWTVEPQAISEATLLCFLSDFGFINIQNIWFLIPRKSIVDGLLALGIGQDAPYNTMVAILTGHGSGHVYVENVDGEVRREGVEHPTTGDVGLESEEEEEVVKAECLSDDNDLEVHAARSKKKTFLANRGTYRIKGLSVDVDSVFDGYRLEIRRGKAPCESGGKNDSSETSDGEHKFSDDEGSFFTGSNKCDDGVVQPRQKRTINKKIPEQFLLKLLFHRNSG